MEDLQLDGGRWQLGDLIAAGGFARVHSAISPDGEPAVLKLVPKDPGAERELLLEELAGTPNVIPILDVGEYRDFWVLAMPRAEMSLRDLMRKQGDRLERDDARSILTEIAEALSALDGRVVHRDVKPENVLRWNGTWCLADFGLARYAEHTTAPDTRKFAMTPAYAAPEQWRFERATGATDVYAWGVVAYEILSGNRPFPGPTPEDFREQHLEQAAPPLEGMPAGLASLVASCLLKAPTARPKPADVLARLRLADTPASPAAVRLRQVNLEAVQRAAHEAATAEEMRTDAERRRDLYEAALATLRPVYESMRTQLLENVPAAAPRGSTEWPFELYGASLIWVSVKDASGADWGHYPPPFEVIAHAGIELTIPPTRAGYHGRSHSLWYCDAQELGVFRWFETAFMITPSIARRTKGNPVRLPPGEDAGGALSHVMTEWQVAWPFTPVDQDAAPDFIERWLGWFADAAERRLDHPSHMPERDPRGSYRTS